MITRLLQTLPPWLEQVCVFALVGGLAFVLDTTILLTLTHFGVPPLAARLVSMAFAVVFTWQMNRRLTFKLKTPPTLAEFGCYVVISLTSLLINYAIFSVLQHFTPLVAATAVGTIVAATYNFFRYRALMGRGQGAPN